MDEVHHANPESASRETGTSLQIELLWALARSEQRRHALEDALFALRRRRTLDEGLVGLQESSIGRELPVDEFTLAWQPHADEGRSLNRSATAPMYLETFASSSTPPRSRSNGKKGGSGTGDAERRPGPQRRGLGLRPSPPSSEPGDDEADADLETLLQGFPGRPAEKLRAGFVRLRGELRALRARREQQLIVSQTLKGKAAAKEALDARLLELQSEKYTFLNWCALRAASGGQETLAPALDSRGGEGFFATGMEEARAIACRLFEQQRMLEEDCISERVERLYPRITPGERCEQLCRNLHDREQELHVSLQNEEHQQELHHSEQTRLACKEGRDTTSKCVIEIRSLHNKLKRFQEQRRRRHSPSP